MDDLARYGRWQRPHQPFKDTPTDRYWFKGKNARWREWLPVLFAAMAVAALLIVGPPVCGG